MPPNHPTTDAARRTVGELRTALHRVDDRVLVGGTAATGLDTDRAMNRDLMMITPVLLIAIVGAGVAAVARRAAVPHRAAPRTMLYTPGPSPARRITRRLTADPHLWTTRT
ncbi:hypothetical protein GCM10010191_59210 [Actinomadura vinacea]|uniref:DUF3618 domain-containing protein n=1 Tax=Actinomadura vinacea TaxID=115336 RepID=A0ABP5WUR4_9ACTN